MRPRSGSKWFRAFPIPEISISSGWVAWWVGWMAWGGVGGWWLGWGAGDGKAEKYSAISIGLQEKVVPVD